MAAAAMATAAGTAVLLYLVLSRRFSAKEGEEGLLGLKLNRLNRTRTGRGPSHPPSTWQEAVVTLAKTLSFAYSETLGKWPIVDLAFGIKYLTNRQGNQSFASVYTGSNCVQLKGPEVMAELIHLLRLLKLCMLFSKKPFPVFLEYAGYSQEDVLLQKPKAGLLKPAFTILRDRSSKCFLLIIRGMHSIEDTLTAATGAVVPFHYLVLHEGGVSKLVLGYAHCGMVAAARWIAKCTAPSLLKAVSEYPAYSIKIVGNSLGGGIAALLTYILREHTEFSSSTCIAFAPAACMTWDLAESGKPFITTIINGSDLVPTCSIASLDNLRSEVTSSLWLSDLRNQFQHTRFLNVVHHFMSALRSHITFISSARTVCSKTQAVMESAQNAAQAVVRTSSTLSFWSCMGARRCAVKIPASPKECSPTESAAEELDFGCSRSRDKWATEEELMQMDQVNDGSMEEEMTEREEAATVTVAPKMENDQPTASDALERHHFFPPGRIMHMIAVPSSDSNQGVGIYETPRDLYGKIRLSPTMIKDHYMPMCKKMMELLIDNLRRDQDGCTSI